MTNNVTMWFDVACPYAWMTSRWLKDVQKVRDITLTFRPMSLDILNRTNDIDEEYARKMQANSGPARVFAAVHHTQPDKIDDLYTAMGTLIHINGENNKEGYGAYDNVIRQALSIAQLDPTLAEAANNDAYTPILEKLHNEAMDAVGEDSGCPIVKFADTQAFFGPVITDNPGGEEAGKIYDAFNAIAAFSSFFEMKRARTQTPQLPGWK
ncbi:DsbA family protein [Dermatophilus congolensis]|uniref:DSBA-like thioredoxin domain n=1 Tax=Dermatophilus congolensis TaxID=1863 RepID=A0A239VLQ2_9MICO|nr:DsbA family protein [Dermatophilus congolensis]MBO3129378.1 disulfide bond formation protein DsbA [Dermatophilus congolensis]MBO3131989.1 disulfide bond formation protein DsbA [Dermatophilus congolensis]MBO3133855.1 disulfide bond formation protein DsbA [Dermatophilus congolensis]MBO3136085.1 disulfide bond formation protein DsbA [Dermatophilus congolensis]MBO3138329.1 disulfide bond formation protein DsbA [Dermatophilus congolensis]